MDADHLLRHKFWLIVVPVVIVAASLSAWLTYLSQTTQLRTTRIEDRLANIDGALADVRLAVEQRVRGDMMREYDRRFVEIDSRIVRLEERMMDSLGAYRRQAPYQERWEAPDPYEETITDPREYHATPR